MKINVLQQSSAVKINVRSAFNTWVEAFNFYTGQYEVVRIADTVPSRNGVDYIVAGTK